MRRDAILSNIHFIIDRIEEKNAFMQVCYFTNDTYQQIEHGEWEAEKRVLMDSDQKQFVYVVDTPDGWEYIRFPIEQWKVIDQIVSNDQDVMLVTSITEEGEPHKSIQLKDFSKECKELLNNMRDNSNYGEDMSDLVKEYFPQTIAQLS